ncbi:MAG: aspartate aminotransferase family protein [Candidatus Odinarchaeum yellowstonii]|uniref:Multifunctional fusion protein n=1 Tax=Odinarchaeota yellowstonii (strain LCB_4) TaxID=1841599 RepID=A0AAF0D2N8_ODILC|nr:MAG: aspartate aminotransferase family protein [Candidatus Odinarchaeum yellowstonii]
MSEIMKREDTYTANVYGKREVVVAKGRGALVWDVNGVEYIDCLGGHGVCVLGHSHPKIVEAITNQINKIITVPGVLYSEARAEAAEKLVKIAPKGLTKVFFSNSGAESTETAIKLARKYTGRKEIITMVKGFHGRTLGALSATWKTEYRTPFEPLIPGFKFVEYGDASKVEQAVTEDTAAVIVEPIQGESGVIIPPPTYLKELREICDKKNILLIFDEVQTGFGRTGKDFACQHWNVTPDIMAIAKGIGGGVPVGATLASDEIWSCMKPGDHGSTFGGNPLACAAVSAAVDVLINEKLSEKAAQTGAYMMQQLHKHLDDNKLIKEIRGLGLMIAVELKTKAKPYVVRAVEERLLVLTSGMNILRLLPPLVITREQVEQVAERLNRVIQPLKSVD